MEIKVKLLSKHAQMPTRGTEQAAGFDLRSTENVTLAAGGWKPVSTGVAVQLPDHRYAEIKPRSGLAVRHAIDTLAGVIDADYRGEIHAVLINHGKEPFEIKRGDRIAQLVVQPYSEAVTLIPVDDLDDTERGSDGFGSTGVA